jgi:hypothetical protein
MLSKMYEDYTADLVPESGHWIAEENLGKCKITLLLVSIGAVDRF